jgi:hypothetical protein
MKEIKTRNRDFDFGKIFLKACITSLPNILVITNTISKIFEAYNEALCHI